MALFWRIWAAVTLVNLAVLTLFVGLATLQFDSINSGLTGERLAVLAERTAAPLVFYLAAIALVSSFGSPLIRAFGARRSPASPPAPCC